MNTNLRKIVAAKSFKTLYDRSMVNDGACIANKTALSSSSGSNSKKKTIRKCDEQKFKTPIVITITI